MISLIGLVTRFSAQGLGQHKSRLVRSLQKTTWIGGLSGTVIDDDAKAFRDLFKVRDAWNFLYYPSKLDFEGYLFNAFTLGGTFTYSKLRKGKKIDRDNRPRPNDVLLIAFDFNAKFFPGELVVPERLFSPYGIAGLGYTYRALTERKHGIMANVGFGANFWLYRGFGLNVQTLAKFGLNNPSSRNYLQHSVGVVYRFNIVTGNRPAVQRGYRHNLFRNDVR